MLAPIKLVSGAHIEETLIGATTAKPMVIVRGVSNSATMIQDVGQLSVMMVIVHGGQTGSVSQSMLT